jgi:hypothetical protein
LGCDRQRIKLRRGLRNEEDCEFEVPLDTSALASTNPSRDKASKSTAGYTLMLAV